GGYFHEPRAGLAIAAWVALAGAAIVPFGGRGRRAPAAIAPVPPSRAGRVGVAGLLGFAAWTALSATWAPLREAAVEDRWRVAPCAASLPLAVAALRGRGRAVRAAEPALAALAVVVVGYGLLAKAGAIGATASAGADGRLDQPL